VVHLAGDPDPRHPGRRAPQQHRRHEDRPRCGRRRRRREVRLRFLEPRRRALRDGRKPDLYRRDDDFRLDGTELPRPSNLYGVSKATGETLGRYYFDECDLSFVAVRIGNLTEGHPPINYERGQAMWLSYRDCAHLFDCCLEAEYGYEVVYGISDNDRKYYSLERARGAGLRPAG